MITLKDIIGLNETITLLDLDVRQPDLKLIKKVVIGKGYHVSPYQRSEEDKGRFEYIPNDINKHGRIGRSGFSETTYSIDWKQIPKQYLDMEVDVLMSLREQYGNPGDVLRASVIPIQLDMDSSWR